MAIRTAVIGAGHMGRVHLGALGKVSEVERVAVVDPHEPSAQSVAEEYEVPFTYGDVQTMLREQKPDYVVVASPALYHAEQSIAAFEAGAHVLCEKPLAMSVEQAEAIVAAARKSGRLFTMGFQTRQKRVMRALRAFIAEGRLGRIYHTRVWSGHVMAYPWGRYHHRQEYSFGGAMATSLIHYLDAALWVLGTPEPVTVSASISRRIQEMPNPPIDFEGEVSDVSVEDFGHAHVRFKDGSSMSLEGSWLTHPSTHANGFEICGVLGAIDDREAVVKLNDQKEIVRLELDTEPQPGHSIAAAHQEFVAAIQGEGEPLVRFREALVMQRLLAGIYESAERGREVSV